MALQLMGANGTTVVVADPTAQALRVSVRPVEVLSYDSIGAQSGALTGLAANSPVFSMRNIGTNLIMVKHIGVGYITTTAFGTPQIVDFGMMIARAFTASDSGGTPILLSGNNLKHRTSLATVTNMDCRIASTATLTAGTRTLDSNTVAQTAGWAGAAGATINLLPDNLFSHNTGDYPLILAQNEGFVIQALTAFGGTGVGRLYVNMEFAELAAF